MKLTAASRPMRHIRMAAGRGGTGPAGLLKKSGSERQRRRQNFLALYRDSPDITADLPWRPVWGLGESLPPFHGIFPSWQRGCSSILATSAVFDRSSFRNMDI